MIHVTTGEWVKYRSSEGWTADGKVLEVRPDDRLVIGQHDRDPDPVTIERGDVIGRVE